MSTITAPVDLVLSPEPDRAVTLDVAAPSGRASLPVATLTIAGRTLRQFWRTPQLLIVGALTSAMFLLIFRFVFGGAIQTGAVAYADWLIPALAAGTGLFAGGLVGVAEDVESGVVDRLRSLPIPRSATLMGRALADTLLVAWNTAITVALGFATGFRFHGGVLAALGAFGLCVLFGAAFAWLLIYLGLVSGSAQAAQGMSFTVFPLVFVSSAYVPVESMPSWLRPVAEHQPFTSMVGAVRSLTVGPEAEALLGHSAAWFTGRSLLWCVAILAVCIPLATRRFSKI
jgi:ABC-2 type transport system permease protein